MKDIFMKLLKEYYATDLIAKKVIIIGEGTKQQVHIFDALMADEWRLRKNNGDPDVDMTNKILEARRTMKAQQLFRRTVVVLSDKNVLTEWNTLYGKPMPELDKNPPHEDLVQYSEGALYFLDIITPYDYVEMTSIIDERGIMQGVQLHPKEQDDPTEGALEQQ